MSNIEIFRCKNDPSHLSMRTTGTKRDRCEPCMIKAKIARAIKDLESAKKELPEAQEAQQKLVAVLAAVAPAAVAPAETVNGASA